MKHIVLTGGGTAGHVTPNIALIPRLQELGYEISYIGSYDGIEKKLIEEMHIPYYGISSGKLRGNGGKPQSCTSGNVFHGCCHEIYSAFPSQPQTFIRPLTSSFTAAIPALPYAFGSNTSGFSAKVSFTALE